MKVKMQAEAVFLLPLTLRHVKLLLKYASHHYDATCRSTALPYRQNAGPFHGILDGWRNALEHFAEMGSVSASSKQIDLLRKCLEYSVPSTKKEQALREELQRVFTACMRAWNVNYDKWQETLEVK